MLVTSWSTDGERLASACKAGQIYIWDPKTGKQVRLCSCTCPLFTCLGVQSFEKYQYKRSLNGFSLCELLHCLMFLIYEWFHQMGRALTGHKQWITSLCWEPLHLATGGKCTRLASAGKDGDVRIWNTSLGSCEKVRMARSVVKVKEKNCHLELT